MIGWVSKEKGGPTAGNSGREKTSGSQSLEPKRQSDGARKF